MPPIRTPQRRRPRPRTHEEELAEITSKWKIKMNAAQRTLRESSGDKYQLENHARQLHIVKQELDLCEPVILGGETTYSIAYQAVTSLIFELESAAAAVVDTTIEGQLSTLTLKTQTPPCGRPPKTLDPHFLRDCVKTHRWGPTKIAKIVLAQNGFVVSPRTIRRQLIAHGIAEPNQRAVVYDHPPPEEIDLQVGAQMSTQPGVGWAHIAGSLRVDGWNVPRDHVRASQHRLRPVGHFGHHRYKKAKPRNKYRNGGANDVWHHDGQHICIHEGFVIHGVTDGHSRKVMALRAHTNNQANTVLEMFADAFETYGLPSRIRGDRGGENVDVASFIELVRGSGRASYLWGGSTHNTRIERLWSELTRLCTITWKDFFDRLALCEGYNTALTAHKWLGQYLYLDDINRDLDRWAKQYNEHSHSELGGQTPNQAYAESQIVTGIRGQYTYDADHALGTREGILRIAREGISQLR